MKKTAAAQYRSRSYLFMVLPLMVLLFALMLSGYVKSLRPQPYPDSDRVLPPIAAGSGPEVFQGTGYSFRVPAEFVLLPDTHGGDARMAPESWLPTTASVTVTGGTVDADTNAMPDEDLLAWAREAEELPYRPDEKTGARDVMRVPGGARALVWDECCTAPEARYALVFDGDHVVAVKADPAGEDNAGTITAVVLDLAGTVKFG